VSPLEFWRERPLAAALLLGALIGAAVGAMLPISSQSEQRAESTLDWSLPDAQVTTRFDENRFAQVRGLRIWGAKAGAATLGADGKPLMPNWRLTGIILEPQPIALVLADGATAVTRVAIGAALPDQGRLLAVDATGIVYERDGCRRRRVLYGGADANREGECLGANTEPTPSANDRAQTRAHEPKNPSGTDNE
jgi:hypothetical protein